MKLREYQKQCIKAIQTMQIGEKKIVYSATGSGKTIIMSELARITKGRILVVVCSTELREQTLDKMKQVCGENLNIGSVQANINEVDKRIVVATRQSLTSSKGDRIENIIKYGAFEYVLIDECHQAVKQQISICKLFNDNCKVIGFSATPFVKEMKKLYSDFIFTKDIESLIQEGYLCEPRCYKASTNTDISGVKTVGGEFVQSELERVVNNEDRNLIVVKSYLEKCKNRKVICFASGIDHANNLAECFRVNGVKAKSIDSTLDSDDRKKVLEEFKNGEIDVICNVNILTTGFDEPATSCIILASPTNSKVKFIQMIGRGLRLFEGKEDCLIIDIVDNTYKHNLLNCKSIFNMNDGESFKEAKQREINEKEDLERRIEEQKRLEEEQERIRMEEIQLFNNSLSNVLYNSSLDWFKTFVSGQEVIVLSAKSDLDYVITHGEDNELECYKYKKLDGYKYEFELIEESNDLFELMNMIEGEALKEGNSFVYKKSKWKVEQATDNQIKATQGKIRVNRIPSKWDVHKFFVGRNLYFAFKNQAS
ncbi:DEAD/DEAH box helicase [Clostridium beijerinckii]|uniref:DEAD/DEAH box helicase n=1 Tax=Clostridium beijerinckii TaxID=1520 RepID=UPI00156EDFE3|nr:DEAD/DEAH box helicase [Clostridium beijerinckii]NRU52499.1 superfamily II DNA or RNA helicase [Clostridium beijerinckii]NYC69056.1 superfamily II DNA or RNA helicase [Clostridium beijerinckii]NYC91700.1 superfamily II DNA or RNA helicase [Clostridium beijerinckii]